ncbi:peptidoglycan -binding protein [Pseudoruegeria sp. SK021]|uniref:peptidoglycan -binding protein n=1 Tax=Pseudoruegeria sp. SK021 TaxID=1933035 RepID=UPI000A231BB7|nr:peptidoglycan -binding protein [Pseudoruegeria sp. SK021]OSP56479.1 flagellar motor protein [Pseudoruegeria sp. SK021]
MALNRRSGQRFQASIWPGFVDAMTGLLLVLIFVLTIFMVVQSIQTETITGQETELDSLSQQINDLSQALGGEQQRNFALQDQMDKLGLDLQGALSDTAFQTRLVETLTTEIERRNAALSDAQTKITAYEAQVTQLLVDRDTARDQVADLQVTVTEQTEQRDALETALALARSEVDAGTEAARLAAARREALEALIADLRRDAAGAEAALAQSEEQLSEVTAALSEEEAAKLAEAAAAEALRARLQASDAELTAMTLSLEAQRKEAENTLTLLAAATAAREDLDARLAAALSDSAATAEDLAAAILARQSAETAAQEALTDAERQNRLLALAKTELSDLEGASDADKRMMAALNAQVADLRRQVGSLQDLLDSAKADDVAADVRIQSLGADLNVALARVASEQKRRAELEAAERTRLEAEAKQLANYRSEFFGRLREVLGDQQGVKVVGDRFVFDSEVLFASGSADLSQEGRFEISKVARILQEVAAVIPSGIDWIIRVDGHTDDVPLSTGGRFSDNWELSQARALSVVRFMVDVFGFPPDRLAAAGFAEFQPVNSASTPEARAQNRRIELKLTER